ncbi:MAG TPA: PIG-L family deacetylase [Hanamia sp.]|nr:PIG-L family deacetylase [Hanamia sp.]
MKINILSPHIDDAAYCLALTISQCVNSRISVTIINCFTVTKWTIFYVPGDVNEITSLRKKEDAEFYKCYDTPIHIINLDLQDAPLRNGYIFQFKPLEPDEWQVVNEIKNYLSKNLDGILFCPLAIGNHVDHAICREAVIQLYHQIPVIFFEDLPYASRITESEVLAEIKSLEERLQVELINEIQSLRNCTINKEQNIRLYRTQITDEICSEIITHMKNLSGERLWGEPKLIDQLKKSLICT